MLKKLGFVLSYILLFSLLIQPILIFANENEEPLEGKIERLTIELLEMVKRQQYGDAKQIVEEISILFPTMKFDGLTTVEGIEAITSAIIQVKGELAALQPKYDTALYHTTQLYLAMDALFHPSQPIWNRYYFRINKDIEQIQNSIASNNQKEFQEALQLLKYHYLLIKPALHVVRPPYMIEKIDSLIIAISTQSNQQKAWLVTQLKKEFETIFSGKEKEAFGSQIAQNNFWIASFGMTFVIFIVLSYVIWKKFKGEHLY